MDHCNDMIQIYSGRILSVCDKNVTATITYSRILEKFVTMMTMMMTGVVVCAGYGGQWNEGSALSNPDQLTLTH